MNQFELLGDPSEWMNSRAHFKRKQLSKEK